MATQISEYKCPACTGPLRFDGAGGKLKCDYCGSEYDPVEIEKLYGRADEAASQAEDKYDSETMQLLWDEQADNIKAYSCPSCGAELIYDNTTAASACPYCGNPTIVPGQLSGALKPEFVIPFKVSKEEAKDALRRYYSGKKLLPKVFASENHIDEIKGVYVPFWLFSGSASADMTFDATRMTSYRQGNYNVTRTEFYKLRRAGSADFEKIPVDGSTKMPDDLMDSIEPYDYKELKNFSTGYLPGFVTERYDVKAEDSTKRADDRVVQSVYNSFRSSCAGYSTVNMSTSDGVRIRRGKARYALMPVWLLSTSWKGEKYLFAMNGQTGKFTGDLPVDSGRAAGLFLAIAGVGTVVLSIIMSMLF